MIKKIKVRTLKNCLLLMIVFISSYSFATSQDKLKCSEHEVWANVQVGASLGDRYLNEMSSSIDISYQVNGHFFTGIRGYLGGSSFTKENSGTTIEDLGGMVGFFTQDNDFKLSAAVGLSYLHAQYFGADYFNAVGVPFEAGAFYSPAHFGFGVSFFVNINSKIKYYGLAIGAQFRFY